MATIEDQWVDWDGIEPAEDWPDISCEGAPEEWIPTGSVRASELRDLMESELQHAIDAVNHGEALTAISWVIESVRNSVWYLGLIVGACGTNKYNQANGGLSADEVMELWLEKAGEIT